MPSRKPIPTHKRPRFTPEEILRAIEGVEAAGLEVYGVEITPTGAIKISTQADAPTSASPPDDVAPVKKQA